MEVQCSEKRKNLEGHVPNVGVLKEPTSHLLRSESLISVDRFVKRSSRVSDLKAFTRSGKRNRSSAEENAGENARRDIGEQVPVVHVDVEVQKRQGEVAVGEVKIMKMLQEILEEMKVNKIEMDNKLQNIQGALDAQIMERQQEKIQLEKWKIEMEERLGHRETYASVVGGQYKDKVLHGSSTHNLEQKNLSGRNGGRSGVNEREGVLAGLLEKLEDLENRSRRGNIEINGNEDEAGESVDETEKKVQ